MVGSFEFLKILRSTQEAAPPAVVVSNQDTVLTPYDLPSELFRDIFSSLIDPPPRDGVENSFYLLHLARYWDARPLLPLCTVCRSWGVVATAMLYENVHLAGTEKIRAFLESVRTTSNGVSVLALSIRLQTIGEPNGGLLSGVTRYFHNDDTLHNILRKCVNLRTLDFRPTTGGHKLVIYNRYSRNILREIRHLSLNADHMSEWIMTGLAKGAIASTNLERLDVQNLSIVGCNSLPMPQLQHILLFDGVNITAGALNSLLSQCKDSLKSLTLKVKIKDEANVQWPMLQALRRLAIYGAPERKESIFLDLVSSNAKNLHVLEVTDVDLASLPWPKLRHLKFLALSKPQRPLPSNFLPAGGFPTLDTIILSGFTNVDDPFLSQLLTGGSHLERISLDLGEYNYNAVGLALKRHSALYSIHLNSVANTTGTFFDNLPLAVEKLMVNSTLDGPSLQALQPIFAPRFCAQRPNFKQISFKEFGHDQYVRDNAISQCSNAGILLRPLKSV